LGTLVEKKRDRSDIASIEQFHIGCAGWTIPKQHVSWFPTLGSHLERYAQRLTAVEINSSFQRPHRRTTYERWAAVVPAGFAFAVKAPREITHQLRLVDADAALDTFLTQTAGLGDKLGPLLFQLPPSLAFEEPLARSFFTALRKRFPGAVVCEPRHPDWFTARAEDVLIEFQISRVAADPPVLTAAPQPGGWSGLIYFRLHGSPRVYYSAYSSDQLEWYAQELTRLADRCRLLWCIFDNTASGAATANVLSLQECLHGLE
jgi:uncharacterized protein YecE (DUF72 family)